MGQSREHIASPINKKVTIDYNVTTTMTDPSEQVDRNLDNNPKPRGSPPHGAHRDQSTESAALCPSESIPKQAANDDDEDDESKLSKISDTQDSQPSPSPGRCVPGGSMNGAACSQMPNTRINPPITDQVPKIILSMPTDHLIQDKESRPLKESINDHSLSQACGGLPSNVNESKVKKPAVCVEVSSSSGSPSQPVASSPAPKTPFPSVYSFPDFASMMRYSQRMVDQGAGGAANHAPSLPLNRYGRHEVVHPPPLDHKPGSKSFSKKQSSANAARKTANLKRNETVANDKEKLDRETEQVLQRGKRSHKFDHAIDDLQKSGLSEISRKTADLMKRNETVGKNVDMLERETDQFLKDVLKNPGNEHLQESVQAAGQDIDVLKSETEQFLQDVLNYSNKEHSKERTLSLSKQF